MKQLLSVTSSSLRALLIQKDTKQKHQLKNLVCRLRALLIQKDTKQDMIIRIIISGLRALLIQKDTKLSLTGNTIFFV